MRHRGSAWNRSIQHQQSLGIHNAAPEFLRPDNAAPALPRRDYAAPEAPWNRSAAFLIMDKVLKAAPALTCHRSCNTNILRVDHAAPECLEKSCRSGMPRNRIYRMPDRCFTPCHGQNSMFRNHLFKRFRRRLFCIVIEGEYCKIARCKFFNKYPSLNGHFTLNCPQSAGCKVNNLKVLSSELVPAEIRLIQ